MARLRKEAMEQETALHREIDQVKQFAWQALEHIPEIFFTFDTEFRFTYANAAGRRLAQSWESSSVESVSGICSPS